MRDWYLLSEPYYTSLEETYVLDWLRNRQGRHWRYYIERSEEWLRSRYGRAYAMLTNSARSALHLAFEGIAYTNPACRVVLMPDLTYDATPDAAATAGLTVTTEDVLPDTWQIEHWTPSRSYIYAPVSLYGNVPSVPVGSPTVVDAAEGVGSPGCGSLGTVSVLSFNGSKTVGAGEGGALLTDDADIWDYCMRRGACLNRDDWQTEIVRCNYRPHPMGAALLLGQLQRMEELADGKRLLNRWYREILEGWTFQEAAGPGEPCWWLTAVLLPEGVQPQEVVETLHYQRIEARRVFRPVSGQSHHDHRGERHGRRAHPNAWRIYDQGLCLPSSVGMTKDDVAHVCQILRGAVQGRASAV